MKRPYVSWACFANRLAKLVTARETAQYLLTFVFSDEHKCKKEFFLQTKVKIQMQC